MVLKVSGSLKKFKIVVEGSGTFQKVLSSIERFMELSKCP